MDKDELLAEEKRMKEVMDQFLANHMRFIENASNFNVLGDFMDKHSLEMTAANLHFAYESLVRDSLLELVAFAEPIIVPAARETPAQTPTVEQPPSMPVKARTFVAFRNGQPIDGTVRSL